MFDDKALIDLYRNFQEQHGRTPDLNDMRSMLLACKVHYDIGKVAESFERIKATASLGPLEELTQNN